MTSRVLLVISADDVGATRSSGPRKDYNVLGDVLGADTIDRSNVRESRILRCIARLVGVAPVQAWLAFRSRAGYDVILTDGEHIGIPLALLLKLTRARTRHITIGHRISASKKRPFFRWLRVHSHIDCIALHSSRQYELASETLGISKDRLALVPYQVDASFWQREPVLEERLICSAGLEFRDYPTLMRAVEGLDVKVVIGAASHWSKRRNSAQARQLPPNVEVSAFDYLELRRLYSRSALVVVPLDETDFQAGVTTILEAMSMGKPVIVTHTQGQTDVVEDRRSVTRGSDPQRRPPSLVRTVAESAGIKVEPTGFYVVPRDAAALKRTITYLLDHPEERRSLGEAGRRTVEQLLTVDHFAERMRRLVA
ncbi:MAG: glycosyltransferase family 4 protein [Chloroflexi bacterium]|nr:glycosyltransferase family 4 protein [Chloroflexota bacterium]